MKIVVLGDTHIKKQGRPLPAELVQELHTADHIIHTGDWQIPDVYDKLNSFGEVTGVYGNVDGEDICQLVPARKIIEKNGWTIGVVHGHGEGTSTEKRALASFSTPPDILIFGHSHLPKLGYSGKTLLFNPGSLFYRRRVPYCSFGLLHLNQRIRAEHVFL